MSEMLPGPEKGFCQCDVPTCELFGTLGRPRADGTRHARGCICASCRGRRNRKKGSKKQRAAQKALGLVGPGKTWGANHEENWMGGLRVEVKAGAQVRPADTAFRRMREQSEAARPIGDNRPFVGVAMPDGQSDGIFMCRLSDVTEVALAIVTGMGEDGME